MVNTSLLGSHGSPGMQAGFHVPRQPPPRLHLNVQEFEEQKQEAWEDMAAVLKDLAMNIRSLNSNLSRLNAIVRAAAPFRWRYDSTLTRSRASQGGTLRETATAWKPHFEQRMQGSESLSTSIEGGKE